MGSWQGARGGSRVSPDESALHNYRKCILGEAKEQSWDACLPCLRQTTLSDEWLQPRGRKLKVPSCRSCSLQHLQAFIRWSVFKGQNC